MAPLYHYRQSAFYWFGHLEDTFGRRLVRAMKPERMTVARWRCLAVLAEEEVLSLGELAAQTVIERPALTHVVDRMEEEALVVRLADSADGRVVKVRLTAAGRALFQRALPKARAVYAQALRGIPPAQMKSMLSVLERLAANLRADG